ncbi:hypothetical protein K488DRAFT_78865 [Vararia minispora EC-137]|uniref:Uncharacterized protein n=1 Tax=Vararia minispora EC-137 TaxID=1314806 RepID=A0ACB8QJC6_9AGAM|nr:hypothetical protein K488DRAFT_78865 [Vararia minispora EC-137]
MFGSRSASWRVAALGQERVISFDATTGAFPLVSRGAAAHILLADDEWPGVQLAAATFAQDVGRVTGVAPSLANSSSTHEQAGSAIIVGTLGKSSLIEEVVNRTRLDVSRIEGQWEAFMTQVVKNPLPGVDQAYVMVGADKRGTIFALYDHSEQIGVSPWYWWADVPTTKHDDLFVSPQGYSQGSPTVKYRGIFLNDEQPGLQNWAFNRFTNGTGATLTSSPFNRFFYSHLFELILRLKGNFLWPAQWSSAFYVDDPENGFVADYYGIVMGTSHEEPIARSIPVEWSLFGQGPWDYSVNADFIYNFWVQGAERAGPYETMWTVGMRGDGDLPGQNTNIQLLEKILSDQRQILTNEFNGTVPITDIPQSWCLYKEVQGYYESGMSVPDDITLLWTDDNWGNVRRYPIPSERNRTGGAGVYYHVDYVGSPRDYKWIQSSQVSKIFEQMSLAVDREATRIWILNVGDLKPNELNIEFFINYGWNASRWGQGNLNEFVEEWAAREFDVSNAVAGTVTEIVGNMTRFLARRKPELLDANTADTVLSELATLNDTAAKIYASLPEETKPAFFQLVYHPVQAVYAIHSLWIRAGANNLLASQARVGANTFATLVESSFEMDYDLELEYHGLLDGKWNHILDQTHTRYYYWQQPMQNIMPPLSRVSNRKPNIAGPMRIALENSNGSWPGDNQWDCPNGYGCPTPVMTLDFYAPFGNRYVDIGLGGPAGFTYSSTSNASWLSFSAPSGSLNASMPETRVLVHVNWDQVQGAQTALVKFEATDANGYPTSSSTNIVPVLFIANRTVAPAGSAYIGFIEGDGAIAIEAAHAMRNTTVGEVTWTEIPNYGRTLSGVTPWPRLGNGEQNYTAGEGPSLEYDFYNFNTIGQSGNISATVFVSPSLNAFGSDRPLGLAVQVDDQAPQTTYFIPAAGNPGDEPPQWNDFVANSIVPITGVFTAWPGSHTLKVWMIEPAVVVQRIVIDTGGLKDSYLGPPESVRV